MTDPIDQLLLEAGMSDDADLRGSLLEFQRSATSVHPMPSTEVAALMEPTRPRTGLRRHSGLVTALVVIGTLGIGATAAAASPEVRAAAQQAFQTVTGTLPPGTTDPGNPGRHGGSGFSPAPSRSNSAFPHPDASQHPGPSDHPGRGATNAATPNPSDSHDGSGGTGHATPQPTPGGPGKAHKH